MSRLGCWLWVSLCGLGMLAGPDARGARDEASSLTVVDGFMVDRLDGLRGEDAAPDRIIRRPLEGLLEDLPERPLVESVPFQGDHLDQEDVQRRLRAARHFGQERQWDQALREYQALIRMRPGFLPFVERAALAATLAGRYASADAYFHDVLKARPEEVRYLAAWGSVLIRLSRIAEAKEVVERALAIHPEYVMARYHDVILNEITGQEGSDAAFWTYLKLQDVVQVASAWASDRTELQSLCSPEQLDRIEARLFGAMEPLDMTRLLRLLVDAQSSLNRVEWMTAFSLLTTLLDDIPDRPFLQMERIRCLLELGETADAVRMADSLMADHSANPGLRYAHSYILIRAGIYDRAIAVLDPMRGNPETPDVDFALACALAGAGRMDDTWPILTRLAEAHPQRFPDWMEGDEPFLVLIRDDPRYRDLTLMFR